jgi:hypothetical protein
MGNSASDTMSAMVAVVGMLSIWFSESDFAIKLYEQLEKDLRLGFDMALWDDRIVDIDRHTNHPTNTRSYPMHGVSLGL